MTNSWTKVFSPGSVGNVGPGFDILSYTLEEPGDIIWARKTPQKGITLLEVQGDPDSLVPFAIEKNTATLAAKFVLEALNPDVGLEIIVEKHMPVGSGVGSSAASAVGGAVVANACFGDPLSKMEICAIVGRVERAITGNYGDNGVASLLGGFVLVTSLEPLQGIRLGNLPELWSTVVFPHMYLSTKESRKVIPEHVPLNHAVQNNVNTAKLLTGILTNNVELFSTGLEDVLIEPYRAQLIPGFASVKQAALEAGALGCSIAGAGPSMFAFSTSQKKASSIAKAMQEAFQSVSLESTSYFGKVRNEGATVL